MTVRLWIGAAVLAALAGCASKAPLLPDQPDALMLESASFADLPGWQSDDSAVALTSFRRSCSALTVGNPGENDALGLSVDDWRVACAAAATVPANDLAASRRFFESAFTPMRATNHGAPKGLFTGYYEAELHGSERRDGRFTVPLYRRPGDLISVDLGLFRPSLKGETIDGKVVGKRLVPYSKRAEIERGALAGKGLELLWVDDPIDAFFLEIQGSGRVMLSDGRSVRVGYDGQNGQTYVPIGRVLVERGEPKDRITMPYLREWIASHGADGQALMDQNPSYVFFKKLDGDGPLGAEGIALTPGRSAAVDRKYLAFGVPLWIDTTDSVMPGGRLQQLFIAQDVGGAIKGPVRADLFLGYGAEAANHAGLMKGEGSLFVLLPRAAAARRSSVS